MDKLPFQGCVILKRGRWFVRHFFYSTFFTSIWAWLYAVSRFVLEIISRTQRGLSFLQDKLDVDKKPFRAMGFTLVLIITVC